MSGHAKDCEADMREYNKLTKELLAEGYPFGHLADCNAKVRVVCQVWNWKELSGPSKMIWRLCSVHIE